MLKKLIARTERIVLSPLADRVYRCNKIKFNYPCSKGQKWSNNISERVGRQQRQENELRGWL